MIHSSPPSFRINPVHPYPKEGGKEWIWVDRIRENEKGRRGLDIGGQD